MRSDLELLVLALVQRGLVTPYDLRTKAGISLGSTLPVLERLEKDKLVNASELGPRRSRKFRISETGKKQLKQSLAGLVDAHPRDLDSILRIAYLLWLNGNHQVCSKFMNRSAAGLKGWASSLRAEADRLSAAADKTPNGDSFKWLKTFCEAARAEAEAAALLELSDRIPAKVKVTRNKNREKLR